MSLKPKPKPKKNQKMKDKRKVDTVKEAEEHLEHDTWVYRRHDADAYVRRLKAKGWQAEWILEDGFYEIYSRPPPNEKTKKKNLLKLEKHEELIESRSIMKVTEYGTRYTKKVLLVNTYDHKRPYNVIISNPDGPRTKTKVLKMSGLMSALQLYEGID